eukprot:gb/GFBE01065970.1/.p1 GENE.gb/GFBE01065970.1/~~gb/GFBE01065970.1/.p1  ORF type:complete len:559 (+),score=112.21 gb/GFBE01065970.1/:1-1677(+)
MAGPYEGENGHGAGVVGGPHVDYPAMDRGYYQPSMGRVSALNGYGPGYHMESALQAALDGLKPSLEERELQSQCLRQLEAAVKELGKAWQVKPFGSAASGFITRGADLDVTCYQPEVQDQANQLAVQELQFKLLPLLRQQPQFEITEEVWNARVPIVKLKFAAVMDVDLSCHNPQALQNTYLLRSYSRLSPLVQQLVLCVKCWAKAEDVCGAPRGHLSSYSFTLMVLYFLQVQHDLPCLPTRCFSSQGSSPEVEAYSWACPLPLSVLFSNFFQFYAENFQWGWEVVSVRCGRRLFASNGIFAALPGTTSERLHVEDPFLPRNLNCVLRLENELMLSSKIQQTAQLILQGGCPAVFLNALQEQRWHEPPTSMPAHWPGTSAAQWHPSQPQHHPRQHAQLKGGVAPMPLGERQPVPSSGKGGGRGNWQQVQGSRGQRPQEATKTANAIRALAAAAAEAMQLTRAPPAASKKLPDPLSAISDGVKKSTRSSVTGAAFLGDLDSGFARGRAVPAEQKEPEPAPKKSAALAWLEESMPPPPSPLPEEVPMPQTFNLGLPTWRV